LDVETRGPLLRGRPANSASFKVVFGEQTNRNPQLLMVELDLPAALVRKEQSYEKYT
jgi:hypothetical protein